MGGPFLPIRCSATLDKVAKLGRTPGGVGTGPRSPRFLPWTQIGQHMGQGYVMRPAATWQAVLYGNASMNPTFIDTAPRRAYRKRHPLRHACVVSVHRVRCKRTCSSSCALLSLALPQHEHLHPGDLGNPGGVLCTHHSVALGDGGGGEGEGLGLGDGEDLGEGEGEGMESCKATLQPP